MDTTHPTVRFFYCDKCCWCIRIDRGACVNQCGECGKPLEYINIEEELLRKFYSLLNMEKDDKNLQEDLGSSKEDIQTQED